MVNKLNSIHESIINVSAKFHSLASNDGLKEATSNIYKSLENKCKEISNAIKADYNESMNSVLSSKVVNKIGVTKKVVHYFYFLFTIAYLWCLNVDSVDGNFPLWPAEKIMCRPWWSKQQFPMKTFPSGVTIIVNCHWRGRRRNHHHRMTPILLMKYRWYDYNKKVIWLSDDDDDDDVPVSVLWEIRGIRW